MMSDGLMLPGLDGANPLGFLAALGVLSLASGLETDARMGWRISNGGWRPFLSSFRDKDVDLADRISTAIHAVGVAAYSVDDRLPFSREKLHEATATAVRSAPPGRRQELDLLASLGTDAFQDESGNFADTEFRMVRSGDSAGHGLPSYARSILRSVSVQEIERTLFKSWDYMDDGSSLRWDPIEDQRYALRWYNPSPDANKKYGARTMRGANALALHGISLLPVQPTSKGMATTGFAPRRGRTTSFTWPIWKAALSVDVVRSLLALRELQDPHPDREALAKRGLAEVYRCDNIAPNKYYRNFAPSRPA